MTKLQKLIIRAQKMKARMTDLKTKRDVRNYFKVEAERKALQSEIAKHVVQYNVNASDYKDVGLVESNKTWVKVADVVELGEARPELRKTLMKLIHSKLFYYTK